VADRDYMNAAEAARALGISPATLYAYVSRGLIRSEAGDGSSRARRYRREDVERLRERKTQRRDPAVAVASALDWGTPVLPSAITLIADSKLWYRGLDAIELAETRSVEQVAALIWTGSVDRPGLFDHAFAPLPPRCAAILPQLAELPLVDRMQVLLPLAAADDPAAYDLRSAVQLRTAARILGLLTLFAVDGQPVDDGIAAALARAWTLGDPKTRSLLNAALILCADHELNVSSFTARCVASAGSTLYAAVQGGLAALIGTRHGGHTARVAALLREVGTADDASVVLAARLRRGDDLPGFGHRLYPHGDPRGAALLRLVSDAYHDTLPVQLAQVVAQAARSLIREEPTIDFGLVVMAQTLQLPPGSALAVFALGRTIGWLGHALEQIETGGLIRPRARYTGKPPDDPNLRHAPSQEMDDGS
jgi:citrate synthase